MYINLYIHVATESTVINPTKIQTTPPWEFHPRNYSPRPHTGSPPKAVTNSGRHRLPYKITKDFILRKRQSNEIQRLPSSWSTHTQTTHRAAVLLRDRLGQRSILIRTHAQPRAHSKTLQSVRNTTTAKGG